MSDASNQTSVNAFINWLVYIKGNEYGVLDENCNIIASKQANTASLKATFKYTIYILNGNISIWVEPGYNPPFYIGVDLIGIIPPALFNTPKPSHSIGNRSMYKHQLIIL